MIQSHNHPIFLNPQKRSEFVVYEYVTPQCSFGEGSKNECVPPQGSLGEDSEDHSDEQSRRIGGEELSVSGGGSPNLKINKLKLFFDDGLVTGPVCQSVARST